MTLSTCAAGMVTAALTASFDRTMDVLRASVAVDADGNTNPAPVVVATGVPCRVSAMATRSDVERLQAERVLGSSRYSIVCPVATDVRERDVVDVAGQRYAVGSTDRGAGAGVALRLVVERTA